MPSDYQPILRIRTDDSEKSFNDIVGALLPSVPEARMSEADWHLAKPGVGHHELSISYEVADLVRTTKSENCEMIGIVSRYVTRRAPAEEAWGTMVYKVSI